MAEAIKLEIADDVSKINKLIEDIDNRYNDLLTSLERHTHLNCLKGSCEVTSLC
jgi:t-SNARE complex subunit (syntaxin)